MRGRAEREDSAEDQHAARIVNAVMRNGGERDKERGMEGRGVDTKREEGREEEERGEEERREDGKEKEEI